MSDYVYKNPLENGYIKIKLKPNEHKIIFKNYKRTVKYEIYESKTYFRRDCYIPIWVKIINIFLYPILLLIHGLENIKELNDDFRNLFNEKQGGNFYSEYANKIDLTNSNIKFKDSYNKQ